MTVARIVDLTQIDFSGPIGDDYIGPVNYLADAGEWVKAGADGRLRYYASGFRNPFGIVIDADVDLWLSTNGNSDPGFLSPDLVYKKVPLGGPGRLPSRVLRVRLAPHRRHPDPAAREPGAEPFADRPGLHAVGVGYEAWSSNFGREVECARNGGRAHQAMDPYTFCEVRS